VDARPKAGRRRAAIPARFSSDLWLVLYALAAGILIVSAGVLLAGVERLWSPSGRAVTLLTTATATVIVGVSADSVLDWLRSSSVGRQPRS
jgi:hypothetical protein